MLIVYVKHYLTPEGINYFIAEWFPKIKDIMGKQPGFISIVHNTEKDENDCLNIKLIFTDKKKLDRWVEHPDHDPLVDLLDQYRSRNYWEVIKTENEALNPNLLEWDKIQFI